MQLGGGSTFLFIVAQGTTTRGEARWRLSDDDYVSVEQSPPARMALESSLMSIWVIHVARLLKSKSFPWSLPLYLSFHRDCGTRTFHSKMHTFGRSATGAT
jgi:hypothetical protein